jgi:hypothetical protein
MKTMVERFQESAFHPGYRPKRRARLRIAVALLVTAMLVPTDGGAQTKSAKRTAKPVVTVRDANHPVISADGQRLAVGPEIGVIEVYDVATGLKLQTFRVPGSFGHAISADGKRVVVFTDKITQSNATFYKSKSELWLFDVESGKELQRRDADIKRDGVSIRSLVVSSPGVYSDRNITSDLRFIADVSAHGENLPPDKSGVLIGNTETNSVLRQFGEHGDLYDTWGRVTITSDASLLAATRYNINNSKRDQTVVWDAQTGRELLSLPFRSSWLALSGDGRLLVTQSGEDYKVEIWNIATGKRVSEIGAKLGAKRPRITRFALSPNGRLLVTSGTNNVLLWDTQGGQLLAAQQHVSDPDEDYVNTVSFSGNGEYLVIGSMAEVVKVWRLADILRDAKLRE